MAISEMKGEGRRMKGIEGGRVESGTNVGWNRRMKGYRVKGRKEGERVVGCKGIEDEREEWEGELLRQGRGNERRMKKESEEGKMEGRKKI